MLVAGCLVSQLPALQQSSDHRGGSVESAAWTSGIVIILLMTCLSGVAATYNERLLKGNRSIHQANAQLYMFGVVLNTMAAFGSGSIQGLNLLKGFTAMTWVTVFCFCFSGLAISAVMKYSDSIVKTMLTALSVVLTALFEAVYLGDVPSLPTVVGGGLIMLSVAAWSRAPRQQINSPANYAETESGYPAGNTTSKS